MSSIALKHSSGNSMSLSAPATNPASDLSLKLPATVGTAGQILKNSSTPGTLEFGGVPSMLSTSSSYEGLELQTPSGDGSGEFHIGVHQAGSSSGRTIVFKRGGSDGMDTESMRIAADGLIGVNKTPTGCQFDILGATDKHALRVQNSQAAYAPLLVDHLASSGTRFFCTFRINNSEKGSITSTGTNTAYNESSDYRLKENEVAISDGIARLKTLKPYRFNFKVEPSNTVDGFFAHEVAPVVPEAVTGEKDDTRMQQMDKSKLVPLLTAALQEAITKIETLETKVAALEAA